MTFNVGTIENDILNVSLEYVSLTCGRVHEETVLVGRFNLLRVIGGENADGDDANEHGDQMCPFHVHAPFD